MQEVRLIYFVAVFFVFVLIICRRFILSEAADLVIRIPGDLSYQDGFYRLDYSPSVGNPAANTTFRPEEISNVIEFSDGLPGTNYVFSLHYTNSSIQNWQAWTASITTTPDPPSNLSIDIKSGSIAVLRWDRPAIGGSSSFRLKVIPLSEPDKVVREMVVRNHPQPFQLRNLTPGATYELQLLTEYENKESSAYISTNFTTKPNTPGRFIVWFRNETTLLVLWQPPYPAGFFTDYKVSIDPPDAVVSETYVAKEGDPPGPAQAAFDGLVPGRAYNISVETVSENEISDPTRAQYRTVPWRPFNVSFDPELIGPSSFEVTWSAPLETTEFESYQVAIGIRRKSSRRIGRDQPLRAVFNGNLKPGHTYQVVVKTVSGSVASWPASGNITTRPLPVVDIHRAKSQIIWQPHHDSFQDEYQVSYNDLSFNSDSDSSSVFVGEPVFPLDQYLLPGRNYSISIRAVSNGIKSAASVIYQATTPASPIIEEIDVIAERGLVISWKSDVTSKQSKYIVIYVRNDTGSSTRIETLVPRAELSDVYPGAGYVIKVFALSHGLLSEPHVSYKTVYPNPPRNLTVANVNQNNVVLKWSSPINSLYNDYLVRYRRHINDDGTNFVDPWNNINGIESTGYVLADLDPGESFEIQVDSVSNHVLSMKPLSIKQTLKPAQVNQIESILDIHNITLTWPPPPGRVDFYQLRWFPADNEFKVHFKEIRGGQSNPVMALIDELHPGVEYIVEISNLANNLRSEMVSTRVRTMPLITSEITIINKQEVTKSLTLRYTPTPLTKSLFDTYRFMLSDPTIPIMEKSAQDPDRKVTFVNLVPGRLYNITLWTISGNVLSRPLERKDRLHPQPVSHIRANRLTDNSISLTWQPPQGNYDAFDIQYLDDHNQLILKMSNTNSIEIRALKPFRNYTFTVVTRSGHIQAPRRSLPISAVFTTQESVPGSLNVFEPYEITPSSIKFRWELPTLKANGIITGLVIKYGASSSAKNTLISSVYDQKSIQFAPSARQGSINGLIPGQLYIFQIQARTRVGLGNSVQWEQMMPIWAPPVPSRNVYPTEISRSMHSIGIRFRQNYFSNANGKVVAYTIIVAEDYTKPTGKKLILPKWQDVQSFRSWPPYQVSKPLQRPFDNGNISVMDFVVGTEICDNKATFCNGPLKPGSSYRFKIRAFTTDNQYSETNWSQSIETEPDNTAFLVGIIVPIILVSLMVLIFLITRRLRSSNRQFSCIFFKRASRIMAPGVPMRPHADNISLPDSIIETSRPVKLKDFAEHYRIMSADSDFRFSEEYEELKHVGREKACCAADLPVNRPKNRFTNILPYDQSRVKLQPTDDEEGSDFINANFVPGFNSPREFVVTQGPLHCTRDDFWRMCWETNSRAIVMLTRCVEKGREKCDHYWPYDTQPIYYGDIQVTILNESHYVDWNITEFRMMRGDVVRSIRHFHFTTWPDFGVPEPALTLVRFVRAFRDRVGPEQRPVIVHCSAGVGRSGTFIALDRILQIIRLSDVVDIFGIVYEMRKERVWMVQTEQQYICIHQCLLAVLDGKAHTDDKYVSGNGETHHNECFEDDEGIAESGM